MTTKIGFLLFPGFPMSCLTSVIEPLRAANEISGTSAFEWCLVGETLDRIESSAGIVFAPEFSLEAANRLSYLLVLAAPSVQFTDNRTTSRLRKIERHGCKLGAISGGVFPLARSGIVDHERLSVHWCYELAFAAEFPHMDRSSNVIEISKRHVTASGAAAAFDLALWMIEESLNEDVANEVACWFQHPVIRKLGVKQSVPVEKFDCEASNVSSIVKQAIAIFSEDLSLPVSVADIAGQVNLSPRHLERVFKHSTGQNPSGYFRHLRMKAARQIIMYTNDSIGDVAAAVGYASEKPFIKQYRSTFGVAPQDDRKRINLYRVESNRPVPSV
ncbi:AraC family transcriptional regulator [Roseibium sp. TrichSKD4]|nr:AraC family transcriptional regulator [Roseibium sp. TrichSKD4]